MLTEAVVLLKSVTVKGVPRCQSGDPVAIRWFARVLHLAAFLVYPQDLFWVLAFSPGRGPASSAFPVFKGGRLRRWFGGAAPALSLALCLAALLESNGHPVAYAPDKSPFACAFKS